MTPRLLLGPFIAFLLVSACLADTENRWWPTQASPRAILRTVNQQELPEPRLALQMMLQSVAGLAAKAVNEGRGDELVWVNNGEGDLERWYRRLLSAHPEWAKPGESQPWDLVDHYAKQGIIKGYILYRRDRSEGDSNHRRGLNCSVNVATSLAGLLDGIIVDEELEPAAKEHHLKLLMDVREKTQLWCFQTYQGRFNRRLLCTQDPQKPHVRDLAIAQKAFTTFGEDDSVALALKWLEPLSPILGWNAGDEFKETDRSTGYGEIQTATDWCLNLPVLMAGTEKQTPPKTKSFDPRTIDWSDSRSAVSFVSTDGDNVQWWQGNFLGSESYWADTNRGKIPFGWSCCFAHLAQLCPEAMDYARETRFTNDGFIEWGGGYYYPDRFGRSRTNRWELLAQHAQRTWQWMKETGTSIVGFNFSSLDTADAHKACETFVAQTDGLLAVFAFQYAPYEGGAGKVFWVKDRRGVEIPVISARYSIWEHSNDRERAGTPAKIAREIQNTVKKASAQGPRYDWVIAHVWSYFRHAPGNDENAENLPQNDAPEKGGVRGYLPVTWCAERLPSSIRVVSPEELVWRIRMQHDPAQTKKLLSQFE